jgi:hypothetical protein
VDRDIYICVYRRKRIGVNIPLVSKQTTVSVDYSHVESINRSICKQGRRHTGPSTNEEAVLAGLSNKGDTRAF